MQVEDAQREVRTVFVGGFWGQLVSAVLWLASAALATWSTPRAAIMTAVFGGFFIFPAVLLLLRLSGGPTYLSKSNPFGALGMQIAFTLPPCMLLLIPVAQLRLTLFYPALMILLGAHYIPFVFSYGMKMFAPLAAILIFSGVAIAHYFPKSFSLGAWVCGITLFLFAWLGRITVHREAQATST